MHELSLLTGVVATVTEVTADKVAEGKPVVAVGLTVGARSGALIDALESSWPLAIAGTACENARLEITPVAATVWCPSCGCEQEIDEFFALVCPVCQTPTADLRRGQEFLIDWVDVG